MSTQQMHHAVRLFFAAVGALSLAIALLQFMGGWAVASRSSFFGGAVAVGMCAFAAYALYFAARFLLAKGAGVTYFSVSERRERNVD